MKENKTGREGGQWQSRFQSLKSKNPRADPIWGFKKMENHKINPQKCEEYTYPIQSVSISFWTSHRKAQCKLYLCCSKEERTLFMIMHPIRCSWELPGTWLLNRAFRSTRHPVTKKNIGHNSGHLCFILRLFHTIPLKIQGEKPSRSYGSYGICPMLKRQLGRHLEVSCTSALAKGVGSQPCKMLLHLSILHHGSHNSAMASASPR